jgi:hypothetical protein
MVICTGVWAAAGIKPAIKIITGNAKNIVNRFLNFIGNKIFLLANIG